MSLEDRFWSKVEVGSADECWLWRGGMSGGGYGMFRFGGSMTSAHRVAYILCVGEIPDGHVVMHTCDNRLCCNPAHLRHGTQKDNITDMIAKGRQATGTALNHHCQRGENNYSSKLSEAQVLLIRQLYADGWTQADIARSVGVARQNVWPIVHRVSWKHI